MATNLELTAVLKDTDTGRSLSVSRLAVAATGDNYGSGKATVGTSEVEITLPTDIGSAGAAMLVNRHATNYIDVGFATGVYYLRLLPGQPALIPLEPTVSSIFVISDAAASILEYDFKEA